MIKTKQDYEYYLEADRIALDRNKGITIKDLLIRMFIQDDVWNFQKLLRRVEYYKNCFKDPLGKIQYAVAYKKIHKLSITLGYNIHPNNFGPGLSISYPGSIIINPAARIGSNCRIHPGVVIGTQAGYSDRAAHLGDNIYIGPGAKIYGAIEIADNIAIGANSVVNRSFTEPGITIAGIPARKISNKGSEGLVIKATELMDH